MGLEIITTAKVIAVIAIIITLGVGILLMVVPGIGDQSTTNHTGTETERSTTGHSHTAAAGFLGPTVDIMVSIVCYSVLAGAQASWPMAFVTYPC